MKGVALRLWRAWPSVQIRCAWVGVEVTIDVLTSVKVQLIGKNAGRAGRWRQFLSVSFQIL